jgi:hypothetical protein
MVLHGRAKHEGNRLTLLGNAFCAQQSDQGKNGNGFLAPFRSPLEYRIDKMQE